MRFGESLDLSRLIPKMRSVHAFRSQVLHITLTTQGSHGIALPPHSSQMFVVLTYLSIL